MKTRQSLLISFFIGISLIVSAASTQAQTNTTFAFQGVLNGTNGTINGTCDFTFRLFDTNNSSNQVGAVNDKTNVSLNSGQFAITLDFGNVFAGNVRWLETQVRCPAGSGSYTTLAPRQPILRSPSATYADSAKSASGANGTFLATDEIRSAKNPNGADVGGALVLENTATKNVWATSIRAVDLDKLSFDFWDESIRAWRFGARLDRNSNFQIQGTLEANTVIGNYFTSHGYLESNRVPGGDGPENGGALVLVNGTTGNKWTIPIRANSYDSLDFDAWNAGIGSWHRAASLSKDGNLVISQRTPDPATLLTLDHPKAKWLFHVDIDGHPELGVFDPIGQTERWNVLDISPANGNLGMGMAASPQYKLLVYQNMAVSTPITGSKTMLELHHPKAQLHFNFDGNGHPELQVKNTANDQFALNVLDIDYHNGNVGMGTDATSSDRLRVEGNFTATGTKAATVETEQYGQRKLYAVEAADVRFSDEGLAHLKQGSLKVELDPIFIATIEEPYIITVTPYGDAGLYVAEIGHDFFVVKAREGDPEIQFAWRLSAKRKGYSDVRLESVDEP